MDMDMDTKHHYHNTIMLLENKINIVNDFYQYLFTKKITILTYLLYMMDG